MSRMWMLIGLTVFCSTAFGWEVPLELAEHAGVAGLRRVSGGVPLLAGQAKETSELRLAVSNAAGKLTAIPAQFRVLARWWRGDNSIRWVLVDFATRLGAKQKQVFVLTNEKLAAAVPADKLTVKQTDAAITVNTGAARFVINRKKFAFLDSVRIGGKELLATTKDCGTVIEDTFAVKYTAAASTRSVEVIESGPLRIRVRARGVHRAAKGKGYRHGMYSYDYFMDFHAGSTAVVCDVILGNNFPKSVGAPCFEDASLILKLAGPVKTYSIAGDREIKHEGELSAGESACLYQDSNGAKTWEACQGYNSENRDYWRWPAGKTASFRGYKFYERDEENELEDNSDDHAIGTTLATTDRGGVVMHMRDFWQQFPKAVEVFADGRLRVALFPAEYKVPHFIEDATAKGHEIVFHFFAGAAKPDPATVAALHQWKVLPRPAIEHIAACGALADLGPFTMPTAGLDKKPNNRTEAYGSRMLTTDGLYGNAYGWQIFGERWRSRGGHSRRGARQPMNQDNYLYRWFVTGVHGWLLSGDARSRHFRDVRAHRIEDVDPFSYTDWNHFRANNRSEDWTRRPQPKDEEITKYSQGRYGRATFWLPNPAHMVLDLEYDRYLLMGDQRSFENMRIIAAHGGYYAGYRAPVVHRATGWSWRALYRYWELTGDAACERMMKVVTANFKKMAEADEIKLPMRKADQVNWWFTFVFCRAAAMAALHTSDPDALFVCKRMAETIAARRKDAKGYAYRDFAELHAVLWHLTGDEKYKQLGLEGGEDPLKIVTGGMKQPANAHWLLTRPPRKKK